MLESERANIIAQLKDAYEKLDNIVYRDKKYTINKILSDQKPLLLRSATS